MDERKKFTKRQSLLVVLIALVGFLNGSTIALPAPFLPKLNEEHGLSSDMTGWIIGVYSLGHLAAIPFISKYASRIGLYELVCWGVVLNSCSTIIFGALEFFPYLNYGGIDWTYVILAMVTRIFQGVGASALDNAILTMCTLAFPGNAVTIQGYFESSVCLGAVLSPAVASGLFKLGGFVMVFATVGGLELVVAIFLFRWVPTDLHETCSANKAEGLFSLLRNIKRTGALIVMVFGGMIWSSMDPILEPELRQKFGLSEEYSAVCFLALASTYSITTLVITKLLNDSEGKIDGAIVMTLGAAISALGYLLIGPTPVFLSHFYRPLWFLLMGVGLLGIASSLIMTTALSMIYPEHEESNMETNSTISGLWAGSYDSGALLGSVVSGAIARATNFAWATTYFAGFSLLVFIFSVILCCITRGLVKRCIDSLGDKCGGTFLKSHSAQSTIEYDVL